MRNPIKQLLKKRREKKIRELFSLIGSVVPYDYKTEKRLKKSAMDLHKFTGKQYHVVPVDETKVTIIDNNRLKAYNKSAKKGERISYFDILKKAYFSTVRATNSIKEVQK